MGNEKHTVNATQKSLNTYVTKLRFFHFFVFLPMWRSFLLQNFWGFQLGITHFLFLCFLLFFYKANHFPISYPSQLLMQELFQIQISYWFKSSNSKSIDSYNDLDFRLNISTSLNLWLFKNYYFIPFWSLRSTLRIDMVIVIP